MKALHEQKKLLQDLELLINKMESEIELLRNINYRYYLHHGDLIKDGVVAVPENISFYITGDVDEVKCLIIDHEKINIESNYQKIKSEIRRLS